MDKIIIKDLKIFAHHGVLPEEKKNGQDFYVSCTLGMDLRLAGVSDRLEDSVSYADIAYRIKQVMEEDSYDLIEYCAERIAEDILLFDERIQTAEVTIRKPYAPIGLPLDAPSVTIERARHEVYIALGSNIGDSRALIEEAVKKLDSYRDIKVEKVSELIETEPYGVTDQPKFLNGALKATTLKTPYELLDTLHEIEKEAGRERKLHWGPRTLDLDILFYDDLITEDEDLVIPHADMTNRDFVLKPLAEIAPYKVHPLYRKRIKDLLAELEAR